MLQKVDLETGIFRILSEEKGPSQRELLDELIKYAEKIREDDLVLKIDKNTKGNLSKKLGILEKRGIIFHTRKKVDDRDQDAFSYFINKDLESFEVILEHLAKDIGNAFEFTISNRIDWKKLNTKDNKPKKVTRNVKCAYIESFIKSPYVKELIKSCRFKPVYEAYEKRDLQDYCGIYGFYEHASDLISSVRNPEEELGEDFLAECKIVGKGQELSNKFFSSL